MATVLNRTTKQLIQSVNTPDYSIGDWIIEPDLSAVAGQPRRYWIITGDVVSLMSQVEIDAVDLAATNKEKDDLSGNIDRVLRAFIQCINDGTIVPGANLTNEQIKNRIRNKL